MLRRTIPLLFFSAALSTLAQTANYVGSATCRTCHPSTWARWSKTRMANVLKDPAINPEAVIPDFTKPDRLLTFALKDVAWVYGGKLKQRYFRKQGDDYFPLPATWDVTNGVWRPYAKTDHPTSEQCDGCHSVNFDIQRKTVTEWNVGCEKCHGPASLHVAKPSRANIVNPARLDSIKANDVCIQCHSTGESSRNPIAGKTFAWPVGYRPGLDLSAFWKLDERHANNLDPGYYPDGTGAGNRMQGNDFITSTMYNRGVTCFSCHDVHGTEHNADLAKPATVLCLQCHGPSSPNGPRAATVEQHTQHKAGSAGNECVACHMPKIAQTIADVFVRSHTFRFVAPARAEVLKMPNACTACHRDKTPQWATEALRSWPGMSPWRMAR